MVTRQPQVERRTAKVRLSRDRRSTTEPRNQHARHFVDVMFRVGLGKGIGLRIRGFTTMRYINRLFTYLLTYGLVRVRIRVRVG